MGSLWDGDWEVDTSSSKAWDLDKGVYEADQVGKNTVTYTTVDGVQHAEVRYGDGPVLHMEYSCLIDGPDWTPYQIKAIKAGYEPDARDSTEEEIQAFRVRVKANIGEMRREFKVGGLYAYCRVVDMDELTQLRLLRRSDDESASAIIMRRLAEDGSEYTTHVMAASGLVTRERRIVRVS